MGKRISGRKAAALLWVWITPAVASVPAATLVTPLTPITPPHVIVDLEGSRYDVEFIIQGDQAALVVRRGSADPRLLQVETPDGALAILQDRRFAPLWPALLGWAGDDLGRLRDIYLRRFREAYEQGIPTWRAQDTQQSATRPHLRALLQYSRALEDVGQRSASIALLREALASDKAQGNWAEADRATLYTRLAGSVRDGGDVTTALDVLSQGESDLAHSIYLVNLQANHAAYLAEAGRSAEALVVIQNIEARFKPTNGKGGAFTVSGSDRQFAWIKACALTGLGRLSEARDAFATIPDDEPQDRFFRTVSNNDLRLRGLACQRNAADSVSLYVPIAAGNVLSPVLLMLQPDYRSSWKDAEFLKKIRNDLRIRAVTPWLQPLPSRLVPALNHWAS